MRRSRASRALAAASAALVFAPAAAHAGGIGRPTVVGPRAIAWGGAFTAVADDATALHHNPAGLGLQLDDSVLAGVEIIYAPRTYKPLLDDGTYGETQAPINPPAVVPLLGYVTRLKQSGVPSRLAVGVGFWNTYGGQVEYDKGDPNMPALDRTQTAVLELVPGVAYEVNDFLQVGAAFRLGIGLFDVQATAKPVNGDFGATGIGAGFSTGIMVSPTKALRIGATYRSALTTSVKGSGQLETSPGNFIDVTPVHEQRWPQSASLGVAWMGEKLGLSAQVDWADWSRWQELVIDFEEDPALTQVFRLDFQDNYAFRLGAQYTVSDALALRGGFTYDTNAVPDRSIERQYLDSDKYCVGLGGSYALSPKWRLDLGLEYVGGPPRTVPDNSEEYEMAGWPELANVAPGDHQGQVYTFELAASFRY